MENMKENKNGGVLVRLGRFLTPSHRKERGLAFSLDTMLYVGAFVLFAAIGIGAALNIRNSAKMSAAQAEMDQIRTAVLQCQQDSGTEDYPDLTILTSKTALKADDALDGVDHGPYLQPTAKWKENGDLADPWGKPYKLSKDGVLTCEGSGKTLTVYINSTGAD